MTGASIDGNAKRRVEKQDGLAKAGWPRELWVVAGCVIAVGHGRGRLASQYLDKRCYIQEVNLSVAIAICLSLKLSHLSHGQSHNEW